MSRTQRARLFEALEAACRDPLRRTTRARLWHAIERLTPVDPELARSLGALLMGTDDDPHNRAPANEQR